MSRLGKNAIKFNNTVKVSVDNQTVYLEGPLGKNNFTIHQNLKANINDDSVLITRKDDSIVSKAQHGLAYSKIKSMVLGVTSGFKRP